MASTAVWVAGPAYGQCTVTSPPDTYVCAGANTTPQTITADNPAVSTSPGFSIDTSSGTALTITGSAGTLTYIDANSSAVTGGPSGIVAHNAGTGATSVTTTGTATGMSAYGILAINGQQLSLNADGTVQYVLGTAGTDLTVNAAAATGLQDGIFAQNFGTGATSITTTSAITGTIGDGIFAQNWFSATDLTVTAVNATGPHTGIFAANSGTGATSVTATGDVAGTEPIYSWGIGAQNDINGTDLTVTANNVSGGNTGIYATNNGTGATSITTTGNVTGTATNGLGVYVVNAASATDLTVTVNNASGGYYGIYAENDGTGANSVTATGDVTGTTYYGILAVNGQPTFNPDGTVKSVDGTAGTDLTVKATSVTGGVVGIYAANTGTGATSVTATGDVTGTAADSGGIYASNAASATDLTVIANNVSGSLAGIAATNNGTGATSLTATGTVTSTTADGYGIGAINNATASDLTVTANNVSGGYFGIYAANSGTGATSVTATGNVTGTTNYGILAVNGKLTFNPDGTVYRVDSTAGTDLTVEATSVTGGVAGIYVANTGTGATSVTATGDVTGTAADSGGIYASNAASATDLTVIANNVSGSLAGIAAQNSGTGATSLTATGNVTSTTADGYGIGAINNATASDLTVTANNVSGGYFGIYAANSGTGVTSVTTNGIVQGGDVAISALSSAGQAITITTNGLVRNSSQLSSDLAIATSGGATTLTNNGGITGRISLDGGGVVDNNATWNTAGNSTFGGAQLINAAGIDVVTAANGSAGTTMTTLGDLAKFTNKGRLTMANGVAGDVTSQSGGDAVFAAGSVLAVDISGTGQADLFTTTGAATITGSTLAVTAQGVTAGRYTVLTADDGLTGQFATVTGITNTAFISMTAVYDLNNAYLDVVRANSFASVGLTRNQIATGGGIESLGSGNSIYDAIVVLPTVAAARDAFDQLSGEIHASAKGMLVEDSRFVRDAATSRIESAFGDGITAALPVMAYGEGGPEMVAADTDRFAVWGQAFGSWGNTDSDGNAAAFDRSTGGLLAGADGQVGGWRVGLLGGYSHSSFDADDRNSSGNSDNYHLGLYGGTNWGAIAFRTGAAYSWSSISTKRSVAFDGFTDGLSADYDAGTAQVFGELAYKADAGQFKFEPFADLAYVSVHADGFTEQGGAAALASAGSTTDATFTTLGLRGSTDLALGGMNATARGMLGWRHAFGDVTPLSTLAFAGGDQFTIAGVPIARDAAVIEAGLDLHLAANASLGLSYTGQFGAGGVDQGAKVDLGIKF